MAWPGACARPTEFAHSFVQWLDPAQVLVGNKCDMDESKRAVPYSKGQALADELGIQFFETSAKNNTNVTEVWPSGLSNHLLDASELQFFRQRH